MDMQKAPRLLEETRGAIADFTVGFANLSVRNAEEDAEVAGSGTLVTVGPIHGILTAAHVLKNLPNSGEVGLVRFPRAPSPAQRQTINMSLAEKLAIATSDWTSTGPDLGFLRLPERDAAALYATNVFFNLSKRRDLVLAGDHPAPKYVDGISGMIAEWTSPLPDQSVFARAKSFGALYGVGCVIREHNAGGYDLLDFEVTYGPDTDSPERYGGMSGGALWRVYISETNDGQQSVADKRIFGVAFFESDKVGQKRIITCHGPKSVYGNLIDAIQQQWPGRPVPTDIDWRSR
jgi:hypothetical protein